MAQFQDAFKKVIGVEGGFTNDPNDSGGATNWGITIGDLSKWRGHKCSVQEVKDLKLEEAEQIYKKWYWDAVNGDDIKDQIIAQFLFDQGVNRGIYGAGRDAQQVLNNKFGKHLSIDGKVGANTVKAINEVDPEDFCTEFLIESELEYNAIIKAHPKNLTFINGWTNRRAELWRTLTNGLNRIPVRQEEPEKEPVEAPPEATLPTGCEFDQVFQKIRAKRPDISPKTLTRTLEYYFEHQEEFKNQDWITCVDMDLSSARKRMWVINMKTFDSYAYRTTHGSGSDPDNDGLATRFSNTPGSNQSSLGAMLTGDTYDWGKHPFAMKLKGLEERNSNVERRSIVMHDASYADDSWVEKYGHLGRSQGCLALDSSYAGKIMAKIKGGSLIYVSYQGK